MVCPPSKYFDMEATIDAPPNQMIIELNQQQLKPNTKDTTLAIIVFL